MVERSWQWDATLDVGICPAELSIEAGHYRPEAAVPPDSVPREQKSQGLAELHPHVWY